jgi:hypothetical protein
MNLKKVASSLLGQRPKLYNSLILNLFGIQVVRILLDKLFQKSRRGVKSVFKTYDPTIKALATQLDRDGIVILNDFLPPEVFNEVCREFTESFADQSSKVFRRRAGPVLLEDIRVNYKSKEQATLKNVRQNRFIRDVIEAASGLKVRLEPTCVLQTASRPREIPGQTAVHCSDINDTDHIWHQDHIFSVYKAWLYIDDVNEQNGAFQYEVNSHSLNGKRLGYEYRRSLYMMKMFKRFFSIPAENLFQDRIVMDSKTRESLAVKPLTAVGRANTLVIANTLGQHRRGLFETGAVRKLVHLDFRKLDSVLNSVPYLNKVVNLDNFTG